MHLTTSCQWLHNYCGNKMQFLRKPVFLSSARLILLFAAQGSQDLTEEMESMMESSAPRLRRCGYCLLQVTIGIGRQCLFCLLWTLMRSVLMVSIIASLSSCQRWALKLYYGLDALQPVDYGCVLLFVLFCNVIKAAYYWTFKICIYIYIFLPNSNQWEQSTVRRVNTASGASTTIVLG